MPAVTDTSAAAVPWFTNIWHPRQQTTPAPRASQLPSPTSPPPPLSHSQALTHNPSHATTHSSSGHTISTLSSILERFSLVSIPSSVAEVVPPRHDPEDFSPPIPTPPVAVALAKRMSKDSIDPNNVLQQVRIASLANKPANPPPKDKDLLPVG